MPENNNTDTGYSEDSRVVAELEEAMSDDASFTSCVEQEIDDEESDSQFSTLTSFEVVQPTMIARDRDIHIQLERDIQMLSQAIVYYGKSESDKIKAHTLLKSILLLYFGDISYRDKQDKQFHSWCELNAYSELKTFPIAAVLLHGSRALIEFSPTIGHQLIEWLIPDQMSWRYAATHGIETDPSKEILLEHQPVKHLRERKVNPFEEIARIASKLFYNVAHYAFSFLSLKEESAAYPEHYGIDVALGGAENRNHFSNNIIQPNGEHGHLYVNYLASEGEEHGGLLLGIEQSAPGKSDQYGGSHDPAASAKPYSASGGDFFCKEGALKNLPIDNYYDSLWNFISKQNFHLIQESYHTVCVLLDLLSLDPRTKDEGINLIKEIVSSSGRGNKVTINELCNKYFLKTNLYRSLQEDFSVKLMASEEKSKLLNKSLQTYFNDQLQRHTQSFAETSQRLNGALQQLSEENKSLQEQLAQYKAAESQREEQAARENKAAEMKNLQTLTRTLMENVSNSMGRFSKNSSKKIILTQLIKKLKGRKENELSKEAVVWLLKNFISVVIRNRYDKKGKETHSSKACLKLLNDPHYKSLKDLLFSKQSSLVREDLFNLLDNGDPVLLTSARYQQSLYNAFGITKTDKHISNDTLDSVMRGFVYINPTQ